jgi:2-amino-4-hydroxy-6-hydroxymethyldihydropteridine diphosphokinase
VSSSLWIPAYVAIGSNLDDPLSQVQAAFDALAGLKRSRLIARSRLYRARPLGPRDQPDFINAAAGLLTLLSPRELLEALKQIEAALGRQAPTVRWGPRKIDLDLLLHGNARLNEADLVIPHAGLPRRNFVLYPLCDIAPDLIVAAQGRIKDLAARVGSDGLALLEDFSD